MGGDTDPGNGATGNVGTGGDAPAEPGAPIVAITSPKPVSDPSKGGVIVEEEIDVFCTVERADDGRPVAESSVVIQMLDAKGNVVPSEAEGTLPGDPTGKTDEYQAHFLMNVVPKTGRVSFRCAATDVSSPPISASATVSTFVDHGPRITPSEPIEAHFYPQESALRVVFDVDAAPLVSGDAGAKVAGVELFVSNVDVTAALRQSGSEYTAQLDLNDMSVFPMAPSGETPILIRATNQRKPSAAVSTESYTVVVDGDGPKITIASPKNGGTVGRNIDLQFSVSDPLSGVEPETIVVTLNNQPFQYGDAAGTWDLNLLSGDSHTVSFPSSLIADSQAQATVIVTAIDRAGNMGTGEAWLLYLDEQPPLVDLDPPNVRIDRKSGSMSQCSSSFDPLGAAVSDLDATDAFGFGLFRAFVWEQTNASPDLVYSGVRPETVGFYLQADGEPLLINNPGDPDEGCDEISAVETRRDMISLTALTPTGTPWYGPVNDSTVEPKPAAFGCVAQAEENSPPHLCKDESSDLTVVVPQDMPARPPAVFALGPLDDVFCTGRSWELRTNGHEGWVCVAARAVDYAGNVGVSAPLRLCYDNPNTAFVPDCSVDPPECTDGCTPSRGFPSNELDAFIRQ